MNMKALNVIINNNCNSRCTFCNIWKNKELEFISPHDLEKFLNNEKNKYIKEISITGGEPTLHPQFNDIVRKILTHKSIDNVYLTTNGSSLKKISQAVTDFSSNKKKLNILVSIDGMPEKNDRLRGIRAYQKALNVIDLIQSTAPFVSIGISSTLSQETSVEDFIFITDLVREKNTHFTFRIAERSEYYKNNNINSYDFSINDGVKKSIINYLKNSHGNMYFTALLDYIENNVNILLKNGVLNCSAGESFVTIKSSGEISPCIHAKRPLGYITDSDLKYGRQVIDKCPCFTECTIWPNINYGKVY